LDERSVAEVAELTGWSESNVKVRAMRARLKLRDLLKQYEDA
jgi:RNA polymerase sigma-70 factor (ECF subfamily)